MKIRIMDDSIRLRLDRMEVDAIAAGHAVARSTHFPGGATLRYQLRPSDVERPDAVFDGALIDVSIPHASAQRWATDDAEVSIRAQSAIDQGVLELLIEKDFECLDPREGEDQSNRFVNPKATG